MIQFRPVLPIFQVVALFFVVVALAIWLHRREHRRDLSAKLQLVARLGVVAILALLLLNPVRTVAADRPRGKSPILVLVDASHSMMVKDASGESRIEAVRHALFAPDVAESIGQRHVAKYFAFTDHAVAQSPETLEKSAPVTGTHTFIGDSLAGAMSAAGDARSGGVLLISDGRDNGELAPAEVARQLRGRGFPVFTACVGKQTKTKDVAIVMNRPQVFASPKQDVTLTADVSSSGFPDTQATVRLMREGKPVAEKAVTLRPDSHTEVTFTTSEPAKGTYRYTVESVPLPGEVTTANNRASSLLSVGNATTQVLVLEGRPSWEAKFLTECLRSDPSLSVDCVFQLTRTRPFAIQGVTATDSRQASVRVPRTRAEFAKYDVVIVGKGYEEFFDQVSTKALDQYVSEDGGHLIFLRGPAASNPELLSALEPVTWDANEIHDFRMEITADGASNPAFGFGGTSPSTVVQRLPTLISATKVGKEKALSVVLARASGANNVDQPNLEMAVLAYMRHGDGLVVSLVGQGLWRWALLPPELANYSKCYSDFWTQLVRWTVDQSDFLPGQDMVLKTDHYAFSPGDRVRLLCFVRAGKEAGISPATITGPDGRSFPIALAKSNGKQADYVGSFIPKIPGDYTATITRAGSRGGQVTAPFSVFERSEEDMNTSADPALMEQIAKAGGGKAIDLSEIRELPRLIDETEAWLPGIPEPKSIWDRWPVLAAIIGLLSFEWIVRRRSGLV